MNPFTLKYGHGDISLLSYIVPNSSKKEEKSFFIEKKSKNILQSTGFIYLVFDHRVTDTYKKELLKNNKLKVSEKLDNDSFIAFLMTDSFDGIVQLCANLQGLAEIKIAEPDFKILCKEYEFVLPTDDLLEHQWYLDNKGKDSLGNEDWKYRKGADAKVTEAWELLHSITGNIGSDTITIAVLDKGFDLDHPDFQGKLVAPKDFSPFGFSEPFKIFQDGQSSDPNIMFTNADHGTACAGIACAKSNGKGIVGVAPNAKLMPIIYNTAGGRDLRRMFRYIMKNGGDVISCSFGNLGQPMDSLAIRSIKECTTEGRGGKGCVIVFATGNDYSFLKDNELANHPNVIAVGATTSEDTFAPYTNRTTNMSVVAPGGWGHTGTMATTDPGHINRHGTLLALGKGPAKDMEGLDFKQHHHFYRFNAEGTSFACPLVAGVAALVLSANPDLTAMEVKNILEKTADKIGDASEYTNGHSTNFGHGRINAANAIRMAFNMPLKLYPPAELPSTAFVKPFKHNYGKDIKSQILAHEPFSMFKFSPSTHQIGKRLNMSISVPVDHDMSKVLTAFVKHQGEPTPFFGAHDIQAQITEDMFVEFSIDKLLPGNYFLKIMNFDKHTFSWANGGGAFTLNFTVVPNAGPPEELFANLDFRDGDILRV